MADVVLLERNRSNLHCLDCAAFSVTFKSSLSGMLLFISLDHIAPFPSASASVTFNCMKTVHLAGRASG